jgi:hypothetical protein
MVAVQGLPRHFVKDQLSPCQLEMIRPAEPAPWIVGIRVEVAATVKARLPGTAKSMAPAVIGTDSLGHGWEEVGGLPSPSDQFRTEDRSGGSLDDAKGAREHGPVAIEPRRWVA